MNDLNVGAKRCGERGEETVLGVGGGLDWVYASGCVVSVTNRECSRSEVLKSGSRSGTDASAETVRLWTSLRLLTVVDVTSLDDELSACLFLRLRARRRAKGTIMRTRATMKRKLPMAATMMMVSLFLLDDRGVEDGVAVAVVGLILVLAAAQDDPSTFAPKA